MGFDDDEGVEGGRRGSLNFPVEGLRFSSIWRNSERIGLSSEVIWDFERDGRAAIDARERRRVMRR